MRLLFSSVPLDYSDSTKGTINLHLARVPASQQPSKGGIFVNDMYGVASGGRDYIEKWGADWDLVTWDSRMFELSPF
jgi:hypothetical protein